MDCDDSQECASRRPSHSCSRPQRWRSTSTPNRVDALVDESLGSSSELSILGAGGDGSATQSLEELAHLWPMPPSRPFQPFPLAPLQPSFVEHSALGIVIPFWPTPSARARTRTRQSSCASVFEDEPDAPPPTPTPVDTRDDYLARRFASVGLWPSPNPADYAGPSLALQEPTPRPSPVVGEAARRMRPIP